MPRRNSERPSDGSRATARSSDAIASAERSPSLHSVDQNAASPSAAFRDGTRLRTTRASLRANLWNRASRRSGPIVSHISA